MVRCFKYTILVLLVCGTAFAGGSAAEKAAKLIPKLGAKEWKSREKAQEELLHLFAKDGAPVVHAVTDALVEAKDPEIRSRLKALLPRLAPEYVRLGERGFLGVNLGKDQGSVKVGEKVYFPINMVTVLPNTAAREAGFVGGEKILRLDDIDCSEDLSVEDAVKYISARGPGAKLSIMHLLPDKKVKIKVVVLGDRPKMDNDPPNDEVRKFMLEEWLKFELRAAQGRQKAREEKAKSK